MKTRTASVVLDYETLPWDATYPVVRPECNRRPVVLLAPNSYLGTIYVPLILAKCPQVIAVVDDQSTADEIHGVTRWSSEQFRLRAPGIPNLLAVDLTCSPLGNAVFGRLLAATRVDRADLVQILAELDLPAVYQTPNRMRELTISRQGEWWALRNSFEDELSRATLDAVLLLRLTFDRRHLRRAATPPEEEYFSVYQVNSTFTLADDEIFCDAGAYVGSTVRKVLAATGGKFRSIHAFEPDRQSFASLESLNLLKLENLTLHNSAVGDFTGTVNFCQTGTMGSHVAEGAEGGDAAITRLDDAIEDATFIKMDLEGFEKRALLGGAGLIGKRRPRMAITGYHYAEDLLEICETIRNLAPDFVLRLRHHSNYFYDSIVYAAPRARAPADSRVH